VSIRRILSDGHPVLREVSDPIKVFDAELTALAADMVDTMRAFEGIGLAAPQVGHLGAADHRVLRRAELPATRDGEPDHHRQGRRAAIDRGVPVGAALQVGPEDHALEADQVTYQDLAGAERRLRVRGQVAAIIQHEVDHLDGKLFVDYPDLRGIP